MSRCDDAWFSLPLAEARRAALTWTDEGQRDLAIAALDAGLALGRRLTLTPPASPLGDSAEQASLRVFEQFPGRLLPEHEGVYVTYVDCIPRSIEVRSTVEPAQLAPLFVPTIDRTRVIVRSPPAPALVALIEPTRVTPLYEANGDSWLPVLAKLPRLQFIVSGWSPSFGFLVALDEERVALRDVELVLTRDKIDLELIGRVAATATKLELAATQVSIETAREVLERVPGGFGEGRGLITSGAYGASVHTRLPRSTGEHAELTRDGVVLVGSEQEILASTLDDLVFEYEGVRYEYIARDISRAILEWSR